MKAINSVAAFYEHSFGEAACVSTIYSRVDSFSV